MAKRSVLDHPKFTELQETLQQPKGAVLGWLECLWHFTAKFTPQGNVGKYTDKQIERWLEWNGEPGGLIKALVSCGWIDLSDSYRLVIHDWHDHCDDSVKKTLKRNHLDCLSGCVQKNSGQITDSSRLPVPSLAMPSHSLAQPQPAPEVAVDDQDDFIPPSRPLTDSLMFPVAALGHVLPTLTAEVKESAWAVCRAFAKHSPMRRTQDTWAKIITPFANTIARVPEAAKGLLDYYSVTDPKQIEREIRASQRYPPNTSPHMVCEKLYPLPPHWEASKKKEKDDGMKAMREAILGKGKI